MADHIVYLDYKTKELNLLSSGVKTSILRSAMGRKLPYGRVFENDRLFFIENNSQGLIVARAIVLSVYNSDKLNIQTAKKILLDRQSSLQFTELELAKHSHKRYFTILNIKDFQNIEPIVFDKSSHPKMDNWLLIGDIEKV